MTEHLKTLTSRAAITLLVSATALVVGWQLWVYYMDLPWTRDGQIRADVVQVSSDVSGLIPEVLVHDNQAVKRGEILIQVDPERYQLALNEAEAVMASKLAAEEEAERDVTRAAAAAGAISGQSRDQYFAAAAEAKAAYQRAVAEHDVAELNMQRSSIRASANGLVTNFNLRPGDYVTAGLPVFALIDTDSFYVVGYFQETKLSHIEVGEPVRILLMGENRFIEGHVQSIAGGITDRELTSNASLLADVTPTFSWVRLAQRIPVRIAIDKVPAGMRLIVGRTASVEVMTKGGR